MRQVEHFLQRYTEHRGTLAFEFEVPSYKTRRYNIILDLVEHSSGLSQAREVLTPGQHTQIFHYLPRDFEMDAPCTILEETATTPDLATLSFCVSRAWRVLPLVHRKSILGFCTPKHASHFRKASDSALPTPQDLIG